MKNNWIGKVLGEEVKTVESPSAKPPPSILKQVLGEEEEEKSKTEPKTEPKEKPEAESATAAKAKTAPAAEGEASAEAAIEPGASDYVSDPVQALASLWSSGGKMDVAAKLLTEPIKYTDFIGLVQAIGPESALELGQILDDLVEDEEEGAPPADSVLSRVDGFKKKRLGAEEVERQNFRERHAEGDVDAINQAEQ